MKSILEWRIHKLYDNSIEDFGNSRIPSYIPNTEVYPIANGNNFFPRFDDPQEFKEPDSTAPSFNNAGLPSQTPLLNNAGLPLQQYKPTFQELVKKWNAQRKQSVDFSSNKGLGELGMGYVGNSTFKNNPVSAGENPTISHGMPVGNPAGMFGY